jgi:hypothetical protein
MAIVNGYITQNDLKEFVGIPTSDTADDDLLDNAINGASRQIDAFCGRKFYADGSTSARAFFTNDYFRLAVDDISTSTGLVVKYDDDDDGTYEVTVPSNEFQLLPINGVVGGIEGSPFYIIQLNSNGSFEWPISNTSNRPYAQITANWGYAATPEPIKYACKMLSSELFAMRNAPLGVAGVGDFGVVNVQQNREVTRLLAPFRKATIYGIA